MKKLFCLIILTYQSISAQDCDYYLKEFQIKYSTESKKVHYGGYDISDFENSKKYITYYITCKAEQIGDDNSALKILKESLVLKYRDDTKLIIAGVYDKKKSIDGRERPNSYYIINSNFEILGEFDWINDYSWFNEDKYNLDVFVISKNKKSGLLYKNGDIILQPKYDHIYWYYNDRAIVMNDEKKGFIDKMGNEIIHPKYDGSNDSFSEGYLTVWNGTFPNEKFGLIDKNGIEIIPLQYEIAGRFFGGLLPVYKDKKWGFVNLKNEIVIPFIYEDIGDDRKYGESGYNKKGVWFYRVQKKYGGKEEYINKKGETFKYWEDVKD